MACTQTPRETAGHGARVSAGEHLKQRGSPESPLSPLLFMNMLNPNDLRQKIGLDGLNGTNGEMFRSALGAASSLLGEDKLDAYGCWFDQGAGEAAAPEGVHVRLLTATGVITVDYEFSFDGYPDAQLLPWARVQAVRVIAAPGRQTVVRNVWLETEVGRVEFAGIQDAELLASVVGASRRALSRT